MLGSILLVLVFGIGFAERCVPPFAYYTFSNCPETVAPILTYPIEPNSSCANEGPSESVFFVPTSPDPDNGIVSGGTVIGAAHVNAVNAFEWWVNVTWDLGFVFSGSITFFVYEDEIRMEDECSGDVRILNLTEPWTGLMHVFVTVVPSDVVVEGGEHGEALFTLYVDGEEIWTGTACLLRTEPLLVFNSNNEFTTLALWERPVTPSEIQTIYALGPDRLPGSCQTFYSTVEILAIVFGVLFVCLLLLLAFGAVVYFCAKIGISFVQNASVTTNSRSYVEMDDQQD